MTWAVMLAVALATAPAGAEEGTSAQAAPAEPAPRKGWGVQGLPLINFSSDAGIGYGARVLLVDSGDGTQRPYRYSLMAQFFQTTRGIATHRLVVDAPGFLESPWRLGLDVSLLNDRFSPYFGLGGASGYEKSHETCDAKALSKERDECLNNPDFRGVRYYTFEQRTLPAVMFNARRSLLGPLQVAMGYRFRLTRVRTRYSAEDLGQPRDSRLVEDARAGLLTGLDPDAPEQTFRTAELTASLLLDTRDNEPAPVRGMYHELAGRVAHGATGSAFNYWGATANLRFYHPVGSERLVAAMRLFADVMGGDVPFFLLSSFGGVEWREGWGGIGGVFSARGIPRHRLQGEVKVLANGELRWRFLSVAPLRQQLDFTLVAFLDAGQAWADLSMRDAGLFRYAGGGGLRIGWEKHFIVRLDYGISPLDGATGFYLDFNHLF